MSGGTLPFVSVVVPASHGAELLGSCLASIVRGRYPAPFREILVIDRDRSGRTAEVIGRYPVRRLPVTEPGLCARLNHGIQASRGDIVAFTDADCVASADWLGELVRGFEDPGVGVVGGAILAYPGTTSAERYAARRASHSAVRPLSHPDRPFAMTANLAIRRAALDAAGGFDPLFPGGGWEDADLCWRLTRRAGVRLGYAPRAVVFHRYRATARAFFIQHVRYGYGLALLHRTSGGDVPWTRLEAFRASGRLARAIGDVGRAVFGLFLGPPAGAA
jgi:cellulose synthase/poly-beta-1,6-N-acetylglucosamine synthase-like glycosyltransferase